jgi:D-beta-D-heptose 7-phosphate kinase/D-beta-D-heptose 1-phosphate adenosyltransferase
MKESVLTQPQKQFKILLIGDDCLDVYQFGSVDRISPEAPVPVFKYGHKDEVAGMAGNVKANLEALGCMVVYMHGGASIKTRLIDQRSKQHILRVDQDHISDPLDFDSIPYTLSNCDAVVISDYNKGYVTYELIEKIIAHSNHGVNFPVFIDTKKTDLERFQGAWVKINSLEYTLLKSECSGLIVTKGEQGAWVPHHEFREPAPKVEVSDVCGAGDTFLSALTYKWCETKDIRDAIRFAIKASAITVQHLGNYAPTLQEIK